MELQHPTDYTKTPLEVAFIALNKQVIQKYAIIIKRQSLSHMLPPYGFHCLN